MFESSERHLRLGNLNASSLVLAHRPSLSRHGWLSRLDLFKLGISQDLHGLGQWDLWDSHASCLLDSCRECGVVDLLVERWVVAAFSVDVVCEEVVAVVDASHRWIDVAFAVCVEGRLAKVCGEGRVRQPPGGVVELGAPLLHLLLLLLLGGGENLLGNGPPRGLTLLVLSNLDRLSFLALCGVQGCLVLLVFDIDKVHVLSVSHQEVLIAEDRLSVLAGTVLVRRIEERSELITLLSLPLRRWSNAPAMPTRVSLGIRFSCWQVCPPISLVNLNMVPLTSGRRALL